MADSVKRIEHPELFFGFVAPIGADLSGAKNAFRKFFERHHYRVVEVKVTDFFAIFEQYVRPKKRLVRKGREQDRYGTHIAYGNQLRDKFDDAILAAATIRKIMRERLRPRTDGADKFSRTAYLLHQFKRKEEIDLLRSVYGRLFFQISVYSRRGARVDHLSRVFASSDHAAGPQKYRDSAEALIQRDENEKGSDHGQRVAKIFHDADFIVSLDVPQPVDQQVNRFCEVIFGSNSISPTRTEYGLYLAKAAALRTLDLSRQVGAAIFSTSGEVMALGSNEVPKAGGGSYWGEDQFDDRDFKRMHDSNEQRKKEIIGEIISILKPKASVDAVLGTTAIQDCQFMDALEYGRIVHAEMAAIADAARRGQEVRGGTLYCTTFPCHMCAKHIVSAGISRVVFLEPYPKSLAYELHSDSIMIEGGDRGAYNAFPRVEFEHFFGVSPRRYREFFERGKRKDKEGKFVPYGDPDRGTGQAPIFDVKFPFYAQLEAHLTQGVQKEIADAIRFDHQKRRPAPKNKPALVRPSSRKENARRKIKRRS